MSPSLGGLLFYTTLEFARLEVKLTVCNYLGPKSLMSDSSMTFIPGIVYCVPLLLRDSDNAVLR